MTGAVWVALGVLALLGVWMLGAYNRLVSLRNAIAAAWAQADEALHRRAEATEQLAGALREPLAGEQGALDALLAAHATVSRASGAMSTQPLSAANAAAWLAAETRFAAAAARMFALLEGHADAVLIDPVAAALVVFRDGDQRLPFARQLFNGAAAAYDEAIGVFPTSLLCPVYGFARAGRI